MHFMDSGCGKFGNLWQPVLDLPLGVPWVSFNSLWLLGQPLAPPSFGVGCLLEFGRNRTSFSEEKVDITAPAHKNKPPIILPRIPQIPTHPGKVMPGAAAWTPPPHAPGVRMT